MVNINPINVKILSSKIKAPALDIIDSLKNKVVSKVNVVSSSVPSLSLPFERKNLSSENFLKEVSALLKKELSPDNINNFLKENITAENLLGEGTRQSAYRIEGLQDYALKVPNNAFRWGSIKKVEDEFPSLNLGQIVAECGDAKIVKRQQGVLSGVPYMDRIMYSSTNSAVYKAHLIRTANMPQKSYDDLAHTYSVLNANNKFFDYRNANNILVDDVAQKFNLVDDLTDSFLPQEINTSLSIIAPLLDLNYINQSGNSKELEPFLQKILDKSFIAAKKYKLPSPISDISSLERALKLANYKKS